MALSLVPLQRSRKKLSPSQRNSLFYHSIFEYPLTKKELERWETGNIDASFSKKKKISFKSGYYFISSQGQSIYKRMLNSKFSKAKLRRAKEAARLLAKIPTIELILITGSLAMENANEDSDIDLLIVTSKGTLWSTRISSYLILALAGFSLRRAGESAEKDRLCMNIWLDMNELSWKKRNIFTAHEILQTKVLVDKNKNYEQFLECNSWATKYWPNAMIVPKTRKPKPFFPAKVLTVLLKLIEPLAFWFQFAYMREKMTREIVTPTKALFHPYDWSRFVNSKMKPR